MNRRDMILLLKGETGSTQVQLFRYLWVGGFAFIIDYGSLFVLTDFFHVDYLFSAAISFILGLVVNYILSTMWVFSESRLNNKWAEFVAFATIGIVGLVLNEIIMYICCEIFGIYYMISKLCSTGVVFFWNFFARKIALFTKPQ